MVTIYDIARKTGYAPATISKALNNHYGVKDETRKAIVNAANDMGYTPNTAARSLKTKKTWLVGVLFSSEVETGIAHPHFGAILSSAQSRLAAAGYDVLFISNNVFGKKMSYLEHCVSRGVEGVIVAANAYFTESVKCVSESGIKLVSVETPYAEKYSVLSDNAKGMEQALSYLVSLGHTKIGHIACPENSTAGSERNRAFRSFMRSRNLPVNKKWIIDTGVYGVEAAHRATKRLLEAREKPTAILAGYGEAAVGAVYCLEEQKFKIPEEISVISFDDDEMTTALGLTAIRQERAEIGKLAAELLISQIEGKEITHPYDNRLETSLIERNSCGRP